MFFTAVLFRKVGELYTTAIDQVDEYKEKLKRIVSNINNIYCYINCDFKADDVDIERVMTNRAITKVLVIMDECIIVI